MQVITISGLDGSGKSTQVERLAEHFAATGEKTFYFHSVHFSIAEKLSRSGRKSGGVAAEPAAEKPGVTSASASGILLRKLFLRIDLVRYRGLLRSLARQGYAGVLSDRYFYDNLVNIAYLAHSTKFLRARVPRPTHCIYLRVDPDAIMSRGRAPEQGVDYLRDKQLLYDALAAEYTLTLIDGSQPQDDVSAAILALLG